ncbi:MAG TPA: hypothetical protein VHZ96_26210 [Frankiaceae bacterium]|jgi:hypothetical protein|nr:hypothetical protein [Frankiaceae bacterium]
MATQLVAERDGVLLRVGNEIRSLYRGGAVPDGSDPEHVKLLTGRGLLVEAGETDHDPDGIGPIPAKSASRADWDAYAATQGLSEVDVAAFSSKEELQKHFGVE